MIKKSSIGIISILLLVILTMYGLYSGEAEKTRQISYVVELQKENQKFFNNEITLFGDIIESNNSFYMEDGTGRILLKGDNLHVTNAFDFDNLVYGRFVNETFEVREIHGLPYTKLIYIALGGLLVLFMLFMSWKIKKEKIYEIVER